MPPLVAPTAADNIPDDQVSQSPLLLQATAGMRLLPKSDADSVFAGLRRGLAKTAFSFTPEDAHLVDGGVEGRYLFAALNTALGKLQQATTADGVYCFGCGFMFCERAQAHCCFVCQMLWVRWT